MTAEHGANSHSGHGGGGAKRMSGLRRAGIVAGGALAGLTLFTCGYNARDEFGVDNKHLAMDLTPPFFHLKEGINYSNVGLHVTNPDNPYQGALDQFSGISPIVTRLRPEHEKVWFASKATVESDRLSDTSGMHDTVRIRIMTNERSVTMGDGWRAGVFVPTGNGGFVEVPVRGVSVRRAGDVMPHEVRSSDKANLVYDFNVDSVVLGDGSINVEEVIEGQGATVFVENAKPVGNGREMVNGKHIFRINPYNPQ